MHPIRRGCRKTRKGVQEMHGGGGNLTAQGGAGDAPEPLKNHQLEPSINHQSSDRPPAVELCKRIIFRYPHKSLWKTIDRKVGHDFFALLRWARIMRKWKLNNWNITNYQGMLENFEREHSQDDNIDYESAKNRREYLKWTE